MIHIRSDICPVLTQKYFQKLKTIDFYDIKIKVPSDPEGYLAYRYGDDWRTPKRKWIFHKEYTRISSN